MLTACAHTAIFTAFNKEPLISCCISYIIPVNHFYLLQIKMSSQELNLTIAEFIMNNRMARYTKSNQIIRMVAVLHRIKGLKWQDMMNNKFFLRTAPLAGVFISLQSRSSSTFPNHSVGSSWYRDKPVF